MVVFCYIYSCSFLYLFKTSGWSRWWKRPRLSSRSILTFLFSWSKNVLYFNILHINWPEDSIKLIQSNLELRTEFQIVSNYSTLILRKIKRAVGTSPNYITCLAHTRSYTTYKLKGIIYYVSQDLVNDTVRTPAYPGHLHLGLLLLLDQLQTQQIVLVAC